MKGSVETTPRPRTAAAALLCAALLAVGVVLALLSDGPALTLDLPAPGWLLALALVPSYVFAQRVTIDFELRGHAHSLTLGQLPLAVGALLVAPDAHVAAVLLAVGANTVARRIQPLKASYNAGAAAFEVGVVSFAVSLVPHAASGESSLTMWLAFYAGLMVADAAASLSLSAVWRLLGMQLDVAQVLRPLALGAFTSSASTALAVVSVSSVVTEPASLPLVLVLAALFAAAYRRHRRLVAQQATTQELYAFVRDLGPVDAAGEDAPAVLERVRLLLHAGAARPADQHADGTWELLVAREHAPVQRTPAPAPAAEPPRERAVGPRGGVECTSTPLFGSAGFLGLLTARGRLGDVRDFDLADVQLLETVGSELATALERGRLLADLQRTATTDPLTGLPNLAETTRLLGELMAGGRTVVLAALTVDSFREVNDTLGHEVGDALLLETAERLRRTHPGSLIGRIGGGRFTVALPVIEESLSPELFGLGVRALVEGEAEVGPVGTHVRLSVGVAQAPQDGDDAATLLRRAETAMTSARDVHGGPVAWAPAYEVQGQRRLAVVTALREAIATGAVGLAFQPKVDLRTGRVSGVEALARWTHPALGTVPPDEFVPLAETSGAIGPLTSAVLRQAATGMPRLAAPRGRASGSRSTSAPRPCSTRCSSPRWQPSSRRPACCRAC
jgi:diguanylate cyclase (GGDEF)-like protein